MQPHAYVQPEMHLPETPVVSPCALFVFFWCQFEKRIRRVIAKKFCQPPDIAFNNEGGVLIPPVSDTGECMSCLLKRKLKISQIFPVREFNCDLRQYLERLV